MWLFRMGIPVNGKNLFPSNIKGLPTWYSIRASKDGYVARPAHNDIAVVMNPETADEDIQKLPSGGVCIIPQGSTATRRDDVIFYDIPVDALVKESGVNADLRERVANMVYVGAVAYLFEIPLDVIWQVLLDNFSGKEKPAKINYDMVTRAYEWTKANITKQDPFKYEPIPGGSSMNRSPAATRVRLLSLAMKRVVLAHCSVECRWLPGIRSPRQPACRCHV